jgi:hypothetical protein
MKKPKIGMGKGHMHGHKGMPTPHSRKGMKAGSTRIPSKKK